MPDDICAGIPDCDKDGQTDGGKGLGFLNSKIISSILTPTLLEDMSQTSTSSAFISIFSIDPEYKSSFQITS